MRQGAYYLFGVLSLLSLPMAARAEDGRSLNLTIYPGNFALVEDRRVLDLPAGRKLLAFPDVSANIRPETAMLSGDGITVVEQNFDYDLLSPAKLMEKALGQDIRIIRTNPATGAQTEIKATVLSTQQGVVLRVDDHIELLKDDAGTSRVIFDKVPDNLRARPTLSVLAQSDSAGRRPVTLSYITSGLNWKADYVAQYNEKAGTLSLQGWVTLVNATSVTYGDAHVRIASSSLSGGGLSQNGRASQPQEANANPGLFTLPEAVTIADSQQKQIGMAQLKDVKAEKIYRSQWTTGRGSDFFSGTGQPAKAEVALRFAARDGSGNDWRLPRGVLRAFTQDAKGDSQFIGETELPETISGGTIDASIGQAFDIEITPRMVSTQRFGDHGRRDSLEYKLVNASDQDVVVEVQQGGLGSHAKTVSESQTGAMLDAYRRAWKVPVAAHGQTLLTAVIEQGQ